MVSTVLGLITGLLNVWDDHEKTKYIDKRIKLEKAWYAEVNRPEGERNDAAIDDIEFDIKTLAMALITATTQPQGSTPKAAS